MKQIKNISVKDLIFLDESGANLQMAPLYGRSILGERAIISKPSKYGNKITMISAISIDKIEASLYGEWAADGNIFLEFVEKCLCPILKPGNVVVMDNVRFHKVNGVEQLINGIGAKVIYLPPYSPELNPIEEMWSKIKNILRKSSARTITKFKKVIKKAFLSITTSNISGWFRHAGYMDHLNRGML